MSVGAVKRTVGSSELVSWVEFFARELKERQRSEWYYAQIAFLLYAILRILSLGKLPPKDKIDHFLLNLQPVPAKDLGAPPASKTPAPKAEVKKQVWDQERIDLSKAAWLAAVGLPFTPNK